MQKRISQWKRKRMFVYGWKESLCEMFSIDVACLCVCALVEHERQWESVRPPKMRIEGKSAMISTIWCSFVSLSLCFQFIWQFYYYIHSADSILLVSETKEKEKKIVLSNGYKGELCQWADRWARMRKNAQQLGKVRVLLSQSVEVYKLRRHLQWQGRDEWVLCRAPPIIQRPVGVVEEKCVWPSDAVNAIRQR